MAMKKKLKVPVIPNLDQLTLESVGDFMEEQATRQTIEYANWANEFPYKPICAFSIARTDKYLYINYFVRGNCLRAVNTKNNTSVWEDSCVEFFVQIPGEQEYYNFEFNCIGTCLAAKRKSRNDAKSFTDEQIAQIKCYSSVGNRPFEEMHGLFAWELIVAIPFSLLGLDGTNLPEKINANFYKCADATSLPHYLSWSPIALPSPNFHCPEYFGEVYF